MSNTSRITVNLTSKAAEALSCIAQIEEVNRTDAVNRALQAYAFFLQQRELGRDLLLRDASGKVSAVHII